MKTMKKIALLIVLATITMVAVGQTNEEVTKILSNPEARTMVMDQISNDVTMSKEMTSKIMDACRADTSIRRNMMSGMMKAYMGDTTMRHHMMSGMMDACKSDTTMRNSMMTKMMDACESDSTMMRSMNRHMMGKPRMKDNMEQRRTDSQKSKAVEGLDKSTLSVTKKNQ